MLIIESAKFTGNDDVKIGNTKDIPAKVPAILPAKVRVKSYETFAPILKLNETKLNISKESTKKGSEAILEQPQNKLKNAEEGFVVSPTPWTKMTHVAYVKNENSLQTFGFMVIYV